MGIILTNEQNAAVKDGLKWFKKGYKQTGGFHWEKVK